MLSNSARPTSTPITENVTVKRKRQPNKTYRSREYLTEAEVDTLINAARKNRHGHRDATMILMAYRHGLRASELCELRWDQVHLNEGDLYVKRKKRKNGAGDTTHQLMGDETRALRRMMRDYGKGAFVFVTERGGPFTSAGFQALVRRAGEAAGFDFPCHPHMLRHACGYALANKGMDTRSLQDYLGHSNIQNTVVYTKISSKRFKGLWD